MTEQTYWHIRFTGTITPMDPLATCPPHLTRRQNDPTPIPHMPVYEGGTVEQRPYFPAAGLRGAIRHAGVEWLHNQLGTAFDLDTFYLLTVGGAKGSGDEDREDVAAARAFRARNPHIGLWGAGAPWMRSRIRMGHAVAPEAVAPVHIGGVRGDDVMRAPEFAHAMLAESDWRTWQDQAALLHERTRLRAERPNADKERVSEIDGSIKAINEQLTRDVSVQLPLAGFQAIPAGVPLRHRMELHGVTPIEAGLFLQQLSMFAADPLVGAQKARGQGRIAAEWKIEARPMHHLGFDPAGWATIGDDGLTLDDPRDVMGLDAFNDAFNDPDNFDFRAGAR